MTEHEEQRDTQGESGSAAPGAGSPVGDTPAEAGDDSSQETGAPRISGEDQEPGQTAHPAPEDDLGVPDDPGN